MTILIIFLSMELIPKMKIWKMTFTMNNWDTECILLMLFSLGVVAFVSIMLDSDKENK
jgi:hypothetical protein